MSLGTEGLVIEPGIKVKAAEVPDISDIVKVVVRDE